MEKNNLLSEKIDIIHQDYNILLENFLEDEDNIDIETNVSFINSLSIVTFCFIFYNGNVGYVNIQYKKNITTLLLDDNELKINTTQTINHSIKQENLKEKFIHIINSNELLLSQFGILLINDL